MVCSDKSFYQKHSTGHPTSANTCRCKIQINKNICQYYLTNRDCTENIKHKNLEIQDISEFVGLIFRPVN